MSNYPDGWSTRDEINAGIQEAPEYYDPPEPRCDICDKKYPELGHICKKCRIEQLATNISQSKYKGKEFKAAVDELNRLKEGK